MGKAELAGKLAKLVVRKTLRPGRGRMTPPVTVATLSTRGLTDALVSEGRALGWVEIRNGDVCLTATGEEALRTDWRTDEEKAADRANVERANAALAAGLREMLELLPELKKLGGEI